MAETAMANFDEAFESFKMTLVCPLCQQVYKSPHYICGCQHIFCLECIHDILGTKGSCPTCQLPAQPHDLMHLSIFSSIISQLKCLESLLTRLDTAWVPESQCAETECENLYDASFWTSISKLSCKKDKAISQRTECRRLVGKQKKIKTARSDNPVNGCRSYVSNNNAHDRRSNALKSPTTGKVGRPSFVHVSALLKRGDKISLYDCESRVTSRATLRDSLDANEYSLESWARMVCCVVRRKYDTNTWQSMRFNGVSVTELL